MRFQKRSSAYEAPYNNLIWDSFSNEDWKIREAIISWNNHGQGEVWAIDVKFADFLTAYIWDYTFIRKHTLSSETLTVSDLLWEEYFSPRKVLVELVGKIVPALYGIDTSLRYEDILDLLNSRDGFLSKKAERTYTVLREQLGAKFGRPIIS